MNPSPPQIYVIAGPNGAGKTSFARHFLPAVNIKEFLNADSIAAGLSPLDPPAAAFRASRLLLCRWKELAQQRLNFGFETTLSGRTYATMLRTAKQQGYQITLCYLYLERLQHSIRRVKERVIKGGHNVPLADLKRRFNPSLSHFFQVYRPLAHTALLYNASLQTPKLIAEWALEITTIYDLATYEKAKSHLF